MSQSPDSFAPNQPADAPRGAAVHVDPARVLDVITRIASCTALETCWQTGCEALGWFGFDQINYGFTRFRHADAIGDPADVLFLTNHDKAHVKTYFDSGFFSKTPMFRWVRENTGAMSWRWAHEQREKGLLSPDEQRAMDENIRIGVLAGYSIGFAPTSSRAKGALGLTARNGLSQADVDAIWAEHGDQIQAIAHVLHLKITQLPFPVQRRPLTDRQRQALEWVADGKTTQDIALLMEISPAMVEKHLRLAREALSVETTAQAVAKASVLNQIFVIQNTAL